MLKSCTLKELIKHIETYYGICKRYFIRDLEQEIDTISLMTMETIEKIFTMENVNLQVMISYLKVLQDTVRNALYEKIRVVDEYISCIDEMIRDCNTWMRFWLEKNLDIKLSE